MWLDELHSTYLHYPMLPGKYWSYTCLFQKEKQLCQFYVSVLTWILSYLTLVLLAQTGTPDHCSKLCGCTELSPCSFFCISSFCYMGRIITFTLSLKRWPGIPLCFFLHFEDSFLTGIIIVERLNNNRHPFHMNVFLQKQVKTQFLWKCWVFDLDGCIRSYAMLSVFSLIFSTYSYTLLQVIKMAEFRMVTRLKGKLLFLRKTRCVQSFQSIVG